MNLLHDPWLPVRDREGRRHWVTPERLGESTWTAFDADRPDFNGALAQFAIGLLQTTTPVCDAIEWRRLYAAPPDSSMLRDWFEPATAAFELEATGARFMQDLALRSEPGKTSPIAELFIEAPGESTLSGNKDLFAKRGAVDAICLDCAAAALLTLQLNAPEGGRGHFTGLRGGGPLTTLVRQEGSRGLWADLWLNVIEDGPKAAKAGSTWASTNAVFPWLGTVEQLQQPGGALTPIQVDAAHVFWAMPRRLRLSLERTSTSEGVCDVCGRHSRRRVSEFLSRPNGINYPSNVWSHPLTPYREKEDWLPIRPKSDGIGYRHWLAWVQGVATEGSRRRRAAVVDHVLAMRDRQLGGSLRLWAFGYEMRKDKAWCWHESSLPLYLLGECDIGQQQRVQYEVARWLAGAELALLNLRGAVKNAWFSRDARGDFGSVDAAFSSATELSFYVRLQALIEAERDGTEYDELSSRQDWHATLTRAALRLFDDTFVGTGPIERQNPRRAAGAYQQLRKSLYGPKLRDALGLPSNDAPKGRVARKPARTKTQEA